LSVGQTRFTGVPTPHPEGNLSTRSVAVLWPLNEKDVARPLIEGYCSWISWLPRCSLHSPYSLGGMSPERFVQRCLRAEVHYGSLRRIQRLPSPSVGVRAVPYAIPATSETLVQLRAGVMLKALRSIQELSPISTLERSVRNRRCSFELSRDSIYRPCRSWEDDIDCRHHQDSCI
jgi:hypothetical protein